MKLYDFITMKTPIDIDVCDDYDERCYIAFCTDGDLQLTEAARADFACALSLDITPHGDIMLIHCDNDNEAENARKLFYSIAGYCTESEYEKYFEKSY